MSEKKMTPLAEYLALMRRRWPRLSMRAMALEAGVTENLVYMILQKGVGARPESLKSLADTWGRTPDERERDYRELMRRAGHEPPKPELEENTQEILDISRRLSPDDRRMALAALRAVEAGRWEELPDWLAERWTRLTPEQKGIIQALLDNFR